VDRAFRFSLDKRKNKEVIEEVPLYMVWKIWFFIYKKREAFKTLRLKPLSDRKSSFPILYYGRTGIGYE
jgi:hypothetical protein